MTKKDLKAYVRYDGSGELVPSSIIYRYKKPAGKWKEVIDPSSKGCCIPEIYTKERTKDGWFNYNINAYAWPTYYLSDVYAPPAENGVLVLPIHFVGIASTYPGRVGTTPSQPQGPVQLYFSKIDANNVDWSGSDFENALLYGDSSYYGNFMLIQNGVSVSYYYNIDNTPAFSSNPVAYYHDEVFGTNPSDSLALGYSSQNNVAFDYSSPIILDFGPANL